MSTDHSNSSDVSDTTSESESFGGLGYVGIFLALLIVVVIVTYISYRCKEARERTISTRIDPHASIEMATTDDNHNTLVGDGLDEVTVSSYRKFTYSQLKNDHSATASSSCSICLADYKEIDLLRMLPHCDHFFHLHCVDPWLMIHGTCPVCRTSTHVPTPLGPAAV